MRYTDELDQRAIDEIEEQLQGYLDDTTVPTLEDALKQCRTIVVNTIVGNMFIPAFKDKIGGKVTTLHNFEQGIVANEKDQKRYNERGYDYSKDRKSTTTIQAQIRKEIFQSGQPIYSGYTGKELSKDGRTELEHIVSLGELYSDPKNNLFLGRKATMELAYSEPNLTMLEKSINSSKGKQSLDDWMNKIVKYRDEDGVVRTKTNAERFGIDVDKATQLDQNARKYIAKKQREAQIQKQGSELAKESISFGMIMALREALAAIFIEIFDETSKCVTTLIESYHNGTLTKQQFKDELKTNLTNILNGLWEQKKYIISSFGFGFLTGAETEIFSFIINNVLTLNEDWIRLIREGINIINSAIKIYSCRDDLDHNEKIDEITRMIMSEISLSITIILTSALVALEIPEPIARTLVVIVVGIATVMITYHFQLIIAQQIMVQANVAKAALNTNKAINNSSQVRKRRKALESSVSELDDLKF